MLKRLWKFLVFSIKALVVFIVVGNLLVYFGSRSYIYEEREEVPEAQTALVLGAAVFRSGELSGVFKNRVDATVELYRAKKVGKILASGDNGTVEHNEVNPARDYLLEKGIPEEDIILDHAGFDTYSTMYRARDIFKVSSVIIVTQAFHQPRAVFIARRLGLEAYGLKAEGGRSPVNYIREIFASEKALLDLLLERKPKYLGEAIPIES